MFTTKIQSIESQIQTLTEQLNSYRTLENELTATKVAIARIKATAAQLDVSEEVAKKLDKAIMAMKAEPQLQPALKKFRQFWLEPKAKSSKI